jgi:hypothetical protein
MLSSEQNSFLPEIEARQNMRAALEDIELIESIDPISDLTEIILDAAHILKRIEKGEILENSEKLAISEAFLTLDGVD